MDRPLVSTHILTYNQEAYLARAIEGALAQQTRFGVEIVVGVDGSTDRTRDVARAYERRFPDRVQVLAAPRRLGAFENSQQVLAACRGKYLAICDGDDYWTDPHKLQKQVDFLETHPQYSLCCHDIDVVCDGVARVCTYAPFAQDTFTFDDAVRRHFIPTVSIVCRRELQPRIPLWLKGCIGVDIFLELLYLDQGLGRYLHENMAVKVENAGGVSRIPETRAQAAHCLLQMYQRLDRHTAGRHHEILSWKISRLTLALARENLAAKHWASFLRYLWDTCRYDPTAISDALGRRLRGPVEAHG